MAVAATTAFAQDALVKEAKKQFTAGDLDQAAQTLAPALQSADTKDKAAAWNLMNDIKYKMYTNEYEKLALRQPFDSTRMINSLIEGYQAAVECEKYDILPNEKGKVKIRFHKNNSTRYLNERSWFYNGGVILYQNHNMDGAIKSWGTYIESAKSPLFHDAAMPQDTLLADAAYNTALLSYQNKDYATAEKFAAVAASFPEKEEDAVNMQLFIKKETAKTAADSLAYLNKLKELHKAKPEKEQYFNLLQDYYNRSNDTKAMMEWAKEETAINANNKMAWALLGEAQMNSEQYEEAIEAFKKAVELDPSWTPCVFNIGVCLISKANALNEQLINKKTMTLTQENAEKVKAVQREAQKYLERTRELDPNHETTRWPYALYRIYYALGMKDKMAELETIDPSLKDI